MKARMKVAGILGAACVLMVLLLGAPAQAANPEQVDVSATVADALRLTVSTDTVNFGGEGLLPDGGDEQNGVYTDTLVATVSSNKPWTLEVTKGGDLAWQNPETNEIHEIPSNRLTFTSASSDSRVQNTRGTATEFGSGTMVAKGKRGGNIGISVHYRVDIEWEDAPGTYTADHTYTVVGN